MSEEIFEYTNPVNIKKIDVEKLNVEPDIKKAAKLGSGARFKALENKIADKGNISDPAAVAASIGRKKYGNKKFQELAAAGKKMEKAEEHKIEGNGFCSCGQDTYMCQNCGKEKCADAEPPTWGKFNTLRREGNLCPTCAGKDIKKGIKQIAGTGIGAGIGGAVGGPIGAAAGGIAGNTVGSAMESSDSEKKMKKATDGKDLKTPYKRAIAAKKLGMKPADSIAIGLFTEPSKKKQMLKKGIDSLIKSIESGNEEEVAKSFSELKKGLPSIIGQGTGAALGSALGGPLGAAAGGIAGGAIGGAVDKKMKKSAIKKQEPVNEGEEGAWQNPNHRPATIAEIKANKCPNCGCKLEDKPTTGLKTNLQPSVKWCPNCNKTIKKSDTYESSSTGQKMIKASIKKQGGLAAAAASDPKGFGEGINEAGKGINEAGTGIKSVLEGVKGLKNSKDVRIAKARAFLRVEKAIRLIKGFQPMDNDYLAKSFGDSSFVPEIIAKEENSRPPSDWWELAISKSKEFGVDNPAAFAMEVWYGKSEPKPVDVYNDIAKELVNNYGNKITEVGPEEFAKMLQKAVAENIDSKYQPKQRKPLMDNGGESEISSDGTKLNVKDIAGNSETLQIGQNK